MPDVSVTLTEDEALVLLDWLAIENEVEKVSVDPAVRQAMWNLEALLERVVAAVVAEDYAEQVEQAKARLTPSME